MLIYLLITIILLAAELTYFRIANHYNIIDKPNQRSSHNIIVLRGGGIIFTISLLAFFFLNQFQYPWFILGLTLIATISFLDDVQHQPTLLRMLIHLIAVCLLFFQLNAMGLSVINWFYLITAFTGIIGLINCYNFMDGINGLTTAYSFTILAAVFFLNKKLNLFNPDIIIYLALGNLIFFFFNFKKNATCFAGDVGSIGMAYALLFFVAAIVIKTNSILFILLFAVYGVDAGLTIAHRILKKENIFKAHRQHLYQLLANEKQWPQLVVSTVYTLVQTIISIGVCLVWQKDLLVQIMFSCFVLFILCFVVIWGKGEILLQNKNN